MNPCAIGCAAHADDIRRAGREVDAVRRDSLGEIGIVGRILEEGRIGKGLCLYILAHQGKSYAIVGTRRLRNILDVQLRSHLIAVIARRIGSQHNHIFLNPHAEGIYENAVRLIVDLIRGIFLHTFLIIRRSIEMQLKAMLGAAAQMISCLLGAAATKHQHGTGGGFAYRLVKVCKVATIVTSGGTKNVSGRKQGIQYLECQHVIAVQLLLTPLAKRDNAGLFVAVGIIKYILEAQQVAGSIVEVLKRVGNQDVVAAYGIGHEADVSLGGCPHVWTDIAAAGSRSSRMSTMMLNQAVCRMCLAQQCASGGVLAPYVHTVLVVSLA